MTDTDKENLEILSDEYRSTEDHLGLLTSKILTLIQPHLTSVTECKKILDLVPKGCFYFIIQEKIEELSYADHKKP